MQREFLDSLPGTLQGLIGTGRSHVENGDYVSAAAAYRELSQLLERAVHNARCLEAHSLHESGDLRGALVAAKHATAAMDSASWGWFQQGRVLYGMGKGAEAAKCFDKARERAEEEREKILCDDWKERCDQLMQKMEAEEKKDGGSKMEVETAKQPKPKTRFEWYQNDLFVTIDVYAKNVVREESRVEFEDEKLKLCLRRVGMEDFLMDVDLFDIIVPSESSWYVSKFKAEVRMKKASPGVVWQGLDEKEAEKTKLEARRRAQRRAEMDQRKKEGWKAILQKEEIDKEEYGDPAMQALKKIYDVGDDDLKRAMIKSYSESGGKVLSTSWEEVGAQKVEYDESRYHK